MPEVGIAFADEIRRMSVKAILKNHGRAVPLLTTLYQIPRGYEPTRGYNVAHTYMSEQHTVTSPVKYWRRAATLQQYF